MIAKDGGKTFTLTFGGTNAPSDDSGEPFSIQFNLPKKEEGQPQREDSTVPSGDAPRRDQ